MTTYEEENKELNGEYRLSLDSILEEFSFVGSDPEFENILLEFKGGDEYYASDDEYTQSEPVYDVVYEEESDGLYTSEVDIREEPAEEPGYAYSDYEEPGEYYTLDDIMAGVNAEYADEYEPEPDVPETVGYAEPEEELPAEPKYEEAYAEAEESFEEEIPSLDDVIASVSEFDEDVIEQSEPAHEEPEAETPDENVFTEYENAASDESDYVIGRDDTGEEYADGDTDYAEAVENVPVKRRAEARSFSEKVINPVVKLLAYATMKIKQSNLSISSAPAEEAEDLGEELSPAKAAKFYGEKLGSLRLRTRLSFVLSLITAYISLGLPVFGSMNITAVSAAVCLIMLLTVMMLGLDIITLGILALCTRKPNINSLVALSCIFSVIDGFIAAAGKVANGLPFCAVSALTVSFSLMGSLLCSRSSRTSLRAAASAKKPYTVTAEASLTGDGITLLKSRDTSGGFVRRVEESGPDEIVFGTMSPYLIAVSVILSVIAALISKNFAGFVHILSGMVCAAVPISILFVFPLPFFISSSIMSYSGSSIAGWSGLYDIGKSKHMIITDRDLFPKNDVKIDAIMFADGSDPERAISYAASMIIASGSALAPAFSGLIAKGNGTLLRVDEFSCHESGGLVALINGEEVFCGSSGFMHLMGIRLPDKYAVLDRVFVAASGAVCGFFDIKYTAERNVKEALTSIFRTGRHPIFAVRDFNVTPQMISRKFDIPTDGFDFPAFTERYDISSAKPTDVSKPAAIVSHEGLGAFVELADRGRRLYNVVRVCVMMSVLSAVLGMLIMFIKLSSATATVSGLLIYMLIWLVPEIAACFFLIEK